VFFLAAGDVRSQKKRVRLFLGFRVFLGFSTILLGVCRNSFLVFVSDGINLDSLKI
jgi:hypothetical protein